MRSLLALGCLVVLSAHAQTSCSLSAAAEGVHICYPASAASTVPAVFHLSAQANAPAGRTLDRFLVTLDGGRIYEQRLAAGGGQRLSIEVNLKASVPSGSHTLRLIVPGAGAAELAGLVFAPAGFIDHCNPDIGGATRTCFLMRLGLKMRWSTEAPGSFPDLLRLYDRNLRSLEADVGDAMAVDRAGHLYVASHSFADLDLRKYNPDGSLVYDTIVRACGAGHSEVSALQADEAGHVWLAANTDACFQATGHALLGNLDKAGQVHGLLLEADTNRPASSPPLFLTWMAEEPDELAAMRVDADGFVYCGVSQNGAGSIAKVSPDGARLLWKVPIRGKFPFALAADGAGNLLAGAQSEGGPMILTLSRDGGNLRNSAPLHATGEIVAVAATASNDLLALTRSQSRLQLWRNGSPCRAAKADRLAEETGLVRIAIAPALDASAAVAGNSPCL